jgi:hypothetical protein
MRREFIAGPMDGTEIPIDDEELTDEIHIEMKGIKSKTTIHLYIEDEETGNYKYEGEYAPEDLYEEEEDEDE